MRQFVQNIDWAATPLGPMQSWPLELRVISDVMFFSDFPMQICWGEDMLVIYNKAYLPLIGPDRHPWAIGRPAREVWPDLWPESEPLARAVMTSGDGLSRSDNLIIMTRNGYPEEAYFTYSQSAIHDMNGQAVGLFNTIFETTSHMQYERRLRALRTLGLVSTTVDTIEEVCVGAVDSLSKTPESVPFVAIYLLDRATDLHPGTLSRVAANGLTPAADDDPVLAPRLSGGPAFDVLGSRRPTVVSGFAETSPSPVTAGPLGPVLPNEAIILPLLTGSDPEAAGIVVVGVNAYHRVSPEFSQFATLVARQIGLLLGEHRSMQQARQRGDTLARLDRAKTEFFQNVSHELRTPMTTILAPLHDVLGDPAVSLEPTVRDTLEVAERSSRRLARVVDALLAFSRSEAGTLTPDRSRVDLASVTGELVAGYRCAAAAAGLDLHIDIPDGGMRAWVDRSMWTTVVMNLMTNALKYTESGSIAVTLTNDRDTATLSVSDTGIGIDPSEHEQIFERFYRSTGRRGREPGVGIGLALLRDIVEAHDGRVRVSSAPGRGSTFTVTIPRRQHRNGRPAAEVTPAPAEVAPPSRQPRQAATSSDSPESVASLPSDGPRLLLVEDEPDLRDYVQRVMQAAGMRVTAVSDAESAITMLAPNGPGAETGGEQHSTESSFDIVLTDLMLPDKSGLELIDVIRHTAATARLPVIVMTGRALSDSATEVLSAGATDYVVKPFSSAELVARVKAQYELTAALAGAVAQAETTTSHVRRGLESSREIGMAIGIVMARRGRTSQQAFAELVQVSQTTNTKVRDVAETVIYTGDLPTSG